jgi:tetratricopeptide (TPR) repeat protein
LPRKQLTLIILAFVLLAGLFFIAPTSLSKNNLPPAAGNISANIKMVSVDTLMKEALTKLTITQKTYVDKLNALLQAERHEDAKIRLETTAAFFWKDSIQNFPLAFWYFAKAAKLENKEKNLTFAANFGLNSLRMIENPSIKTWMADSTKQLFEKALIINPTSDSLKVGLGACYIFGSVSNSPQETMKGIQQILQVANADSTNMYAQFMLGLGGITSGQIAKAIVRLEKVVKNQPNNLEAISYLAEAYEQNGDLAKAINLYQFLKNGINNEALKKELETRIKMLEKNNK